MAMTDSNALCVQTHRDGGQRRALPSQRLCGSCYDRLRHDLEALPRLHADLGGALAAGATPRYGQRVTGGGATPLPINPAVADHRDQIHHDLAWWVCNVADRRGLRTLPTDGVPEICAWLLTHINWIAADQDAARDFPPVVRELAGRARALLDPNRRLPTGERCRMKPDGGDRCSGVITMVQTPEETWTARCSVCGPQEAAPYLRDKIAGRWVTIERVRAYARRAHGVDVAAATIRSWAHRGHIRTTDSHGAVWYDLASVETYLTMRRAEKMAG